MEVTPRTIDYYHTENGYTPYHDWYHRLKDLKAKLIIDRRLTRVERGLLGDCNEVGEGVFELRIDFGSGYRIYFGQQEHTIILLLCGGDKNSQKKDIRLAQTYWMDHERRQIK